MLGGSLHKSEIMNNNNERCSKCVIPRSAHGIKFDEKGCCELCNNSLSAKSTENNAENIKRHIDVIKQIGRGRSYDCLVGLSGGRDSSYLLYLLVKKHNLRCLAAYHRTPFTPDIIDENVRRLTKKLNVPLVEIDISKEKHVLFAKKMMYLWIKKPDNIIANLACAPCKQHNHEVYKIAQKNNISYIVFGGNKFEHFQIGAAQSKRLKIQESKEINSWQKFEQMLVVAKRGISILFKHPELLLDFSKLFKSSILHLNNRTLYLRIRYSNIKMMDYYYIAGYDEKAVIEFLSDVGWETPDNCNSTWRADCSFNELKNYMFKNGAGMTYTDAYLSNMIRAGALTRKEALIRAKIEGKISHERIKEVSDILEIPVDSFS